MTAEQYREDLLRDGFINGITCTAIRQRLLEKDDLTLDAAFEQAFSLDRAQQQSSSYSSCIAAADKPLTRPLVLGKDAEKSLSCSKWTAKNAV